MATTVIHHNPQGVVKKTSKPKVVLKRRFISDVVEVEEKPPPKPPKVHDSGVSEDVLSELSDAFELLFDPNYFGHLTFDEQLKRFKSRDLLEAKLYKTALKAFGNQRFVRERLAKDNGRRRVFVAQPLAELRGFDTFSSATCLPSIQSDARRSADGAKAVSEGDKEYVDPASKEMSRYEEWLKKRQVQYNDLERMGDVERYLKGKGQLSSMEINALRRIEENRKSTTTEQVQKGVTDLLTRPQSSVKVKRPSPLALFIIDSELRKRKLRLSDLFTSIDKDKDWLLTRDEFRKAMRINRVPLPEPLLEDMIITLDQDNNNQLDYRELARGLDHYRRERRTPEYLALLSEQSNQYLLSRDSGTSPRTGASGNNAEAGGATSPTETASTDSLRPGEFDTSQERYSVNNAEASAELRRHDRVALRYMRRGRHRQNEFKSMVKTFDRDIDNHVTPSCLPERLMAEMVDAFRQRQLREFMAIVDACKEKGVVFSEKLYRRVLLYPADRSRKAMGKQIRPPGDNTEVPLNVLLRPADRASIAAGCKSVGPTSGPGVGNSSGPGAHLLRRRTTGDDSAWRRVRATSMAGVGRGLPTRQDLQVDDEDAEQELPTGTAQVRRKVDCWLTFEEFERLTAGLDYSKQAGLRSPNRDAFWPGRLEGRVRCYLEGDSVYGQGVFFQPTQRPHVSGRSHPYLPRETWPVVDGHVTYGSIDPMLAHEITGQRVGL